MKTAESQFEEIHRGPLSVDRDEAESKVQKKIISKVKRVYSEQQPVRSELRYKPYYLFETHLSKEHFLGEDFETDGAVVVDGVTGVTRPLMDQDIDLTAEEVATGNLLETNVDEGEAITEANSRRMQIAAREKGEVSLDEDYTMIYKPIWLVELSSGEVKVVDGETGRVVSDMVFG